MLCWYHGVDALPGVRRQFLRKAAIGLAILLVLVLAGLILVPQLVDFDRFKEPIAAQIAARTGLHVTFGGQIGLTLLPGPAVTARDVRIANPPGAVSKDMVRLRAVEVKLAFWPLLSGTIELRSATLIEPEIDLERLPDGTRNWSLQVPGPASAPAASGDARAREAPAADTKALAVPIDRLAIQNGAVTYHSGTIVERFEHINASVIFGGLMGPYHAAGDMVARGAALGFEAQSGRLDASEIPIQLTITAKPVARLQIDAVVTGAADDRHVEGKLKLTADDLQALASTLSRMPMPTAMVQPLTLSGDIAGSGQQVALEHAVADFGPVHCEGNVRFEPGTPPSLSMVLSVNRLDLDHVAIGRKAQVSSPLGWIGAARAATPDAAAPISDHPARLLGGLVLPPGIVASLDLGVDTVLWHGDLIREARLKASLADGRLTLSRLAALLPGGADLTLSGSATTEPDGPHAVAVIEASADDLRSLFGWFGVPVDAVPADRLRKASLSSRVALAGDRLDLSAIDATLDATRLTGAATIILRGRPGVGLRIAADRLNLDAYLPKAASPPRGKAADAAPVTSKPAEKAASNGMLTSFDANLDAHVDALTWRGQPLADVRLASTLQNGEFTVRELSVGDVGGASAKLSGVIEGFTAGIPKGQIAFDMHGPEFERVLRLLSTSLAAGRTYGAFRFGGGAQSSGDGYSVDSDLEMLDGHAHVTGQVAPDNNRIDLVLDVDHPSFTRLVRTFDPTFRPAGGDLGPLKFAGQIVGDLTQFELKDLSMAIGASTLEGSAAVTLGDARPKISANLKLGDWAIDRLLPVRRSASLGGGMRPVGLSRGVQLAQAGAAPAGIAPGASWSREPLDLGLLALADVDLNVSGNSVAYGAWRLEQPVMSAALTGGTLEVKQLAGGFLGGAAAVKGEIRTSSTPALRAHIALDSVDLKRTLAGAAGVSVIDGQFDLDADLTSTGANAAELVSHLDGDASVKGRDGDISGVNLRAMNERLAVLNRPADLIALLRSATGGRTPFSTLTGTFHVQDGIARSDDIRLSAEGGEGKATALLDLPHWTTQSRIEFRLTGAADIPPVAMRIDGPLDAPRNVFDVNALEEYLARRMLNKTMVPAQTTSPPQP